ncbi:MAG: hypothetical protein ACE5HQ_03450 [Gemmatimonadota bacterium]
MRLVIQAGGRSRRSGLRAAARRGCLGSALFLGVLATGCSRGEPRVPPRAEPGAQRVNLVGADPVYQILPSAAAFSDRLPERLRESPPGDATPFGNRVARISGTIRIRAVDRGDDLLPDPPYTRDEARVTAEFTTADGTQWRIRQTRVAARLPDGSPRLFAGVGMDQLVHGDTGRENPLMPKMEAALTMWGFADVFKDGELVKRDALLHIMLTSRARDLEDGHYLDYDVSGQPVQEIHLFLNPGNQLPAPGGFLHVNWERSKMEP